MMCHSRAANFVLSTSTVQLNRGEQIARWESDGVLTMNHTASDTAQWRRELIAKAGDEKSALSMLPLVTPNDRQRPAPKDSPLLARPPEGLPRIVNPHDASASLHDRARAYLHANCSHCHMRNSGGNSAMQLAWQIAETEMDIFNVTPMHTTFGLTDVKLLAPGLPAQSLIVHRTVLRGPGQMPPVGTILPDGAGVNLLAQWIASKPESPAASKTPPP